MRYVIIILAKQTCGDITNKLDLNKKKKICKTGCYKAQKMLFITAYFNTAYGFDRPTMLTKFVPNWKCITKKLMIS